MGFVWSNILISDRWIRDEPFPRNRLALVPLYNSNFQNYKHYVHNIIMYTDIPKIFYHICAELTISSFFSVLNGTERLSLYIFVHSISIYAECTYIY